MFLHPSVSHSVNRGCIPACNGRGLYTPLGKYPPRPGKNQPPRQTSPGKHPLGRHPNLWDGNWSGRHASYWNAFLLVFYCPQTKFAKVMFLQVSVILSTGGACVVARGACMVAPGGMRGCSGGVHGCSGGACMVALGGMRGCSGGGMCGCSRGGMHGCSGGACVVALGGHAWLFRWDTVNERVVRILLECILVFSFMKKLMKWGPYPHELWWRNWICPENFMTTEADPGFYTAAGEKNGRKKPNQVICDYF